MKKIFTKKKHKLFYVKNAKKMDPGYPPTANSGVTDNENFWKMIRSRRKQKGILWSKVLKAL